MTRAVLVALMLVMAMSGGAPRAADGTSHAMGLWTPHPAVRHLLGGVSRFVFGVG